MRAEEKEQPSFRDVRDEVTGKKLFRYDDARDIIEARQGGKRYLVDMRRVRAEGPRKD
jgi:hypothetical protein